MTTKEQERKALEQIRKIIAGLGEGSYIATAFDGCLDDAEMNIEDDAAYSWKDRAASALARENDALVKLEKLRAVIDAKDDSVRHMTESFKQLEEENGRLRSECKKWSDSSVAMLTERDEAVRKAEAQATEIMRLKARLFDLLCKE